MRYTNSTLHTIGRAAKEMTGVFAYQHGGNPGDGMSYTDGMDMITWYTRTSRTAAREAAAYYCGGMAQWAETTGTPIPEAAADAVAELSQGQPPAVRTWWDRGVERARLHLELKGHKPGR